jgi:putative DNA primase/helicase
MPGFPNGTAIHYPRGCGFGPGYSLTIDTQYEIALWLYGPPGCGKSTVISGFEAMLGPRAGVFGLANVERSQFSLTNILGKTLLTSTEQPSGFVVATQIVNAIISGERIEIDIKFKNPVIFKPCAKLLWSMNDLPRTNDPNNGLYRRVKVILFPPLAPEKRLPDLKAAIKNEGAGILNWALDGLDRLRKRHRFEIPGCVLDATAQFQKTNDTARLFVEEKCSVSPSFKIKSSDLYDAYSRWCYFNGHKPKSSTSVAEDWKRLGFTRMKSNGCSWWHGLMEIKANLVEGVDTWTL